jgi:hypothetical protein
VAAGPVRRSSLFAVVAAIALSAVGGAAVGLGSPPWLAGVVGAASALIAATLVDAANRVRATTAVLEFEQEPAITQVSLEQKIDLLLNSMKESASLVEQVSAELNAWALTAKRLQEEAEQAKALAALNEEQAAAMQRLVRAEMERELSSTRRDIFRDSIRIGVLSFIAGGLVSFLVTLLVHPLHQFFLMQSIKLECMPHKSVVRSSADIGGPTAIARPPGTEQHPGDGLGRGPVLSGRLMGVDSKCVRHVGVPDPVGHDLRVHTGIE